MTAKKTTKKAATAKNTKPAKNAKPAEQTPAPDVIDAGGGILVEIAPPPAKTGKAKPAKKPEPRRVEGSLSTAFREAGDVHGISDPPEKTTKKKGKPATEAKPKKMSALDAAAKVLAKGEPMNTKRLIEAMSEQGLWISPGGATPWATLYAAITREIKTKGPTDCRFKKMDKGLFGFNFESYGK